MKEMFVLIILVWAIFGFIGVIQNCSYSRRTNWCMIIFMLTVPFLPLFAKMCNLIQI